MNLELRSVRIKNCGPIDDIKIDFFDASGKTLPVCVIGGANGSGKTTVLEVVWRMALMISTQSYAGKAGEYLQVDWLIGEKSFSTFYGTPPIGTVLAKKYCGIKRELSKLGKGQVLSFESSAFYPVIKQKIEQLHNGVDSGTGSKIYPLGIGSLIYLPHNRSLEPVFSDQVQKETDQYEFVRRIESVRQFPGSLTSYLIWLEYSDTDRFEVMRQFLNNLNFDGKTFHVNRKELDVFVKTKDGHEHKLHELSSGEQNLLIILIELYRKLLPGSVVLIDEIENSLHPAYQHRLAQGLLALQKEIPYQLIVTTHAPAFVEIFGEENTRLLTPF